MVYVTHDQVEAMTLADKIVVLKAGVVQQVGAPLDLYRDPQNMFVAGFIGSPGMNFLKGKVVGSGQGSARIALEDAPGQVFDLPTRAAAENGATVHIGVRPEHIGLGAGQLTLPVTAEFTEELGGTGYLHVLTETGAEMTVECRESRPQPKERISLSLRVPEMLAFDAEGRRLS
jgi:lactose/L-arabinose transport system ATP-binding protein